MLSYLINSTVSDMVISVFSKNPEPFTENTDTGFGMSSTPAGAIFSSLCLHIFILNAARLLSRVP